MTSRDTCAVKKKSNEEIRQEEIRSGFDNFFKEVDLERVESCSQLAAAGTTLNKGGGPKMLNRFDHNQRNFLTDKLFVGTIDLPGNALVLKQKCT